MLTVCSEAMARLARAAAKPCLSKSQLLFPLSRMLRLNTSLITYEYSVYLLCIQRRIQKWIQSRVFAQPSGNRRCVSGSISSRIFVVAVDTGRYNTLVTHRLRVTTKGGLHALGLGPSATQAGARACHATHDGLAGLFLVFRALHLTVSRRTHYTAV